MPRVTLGVILGLSIGIADVLLMLPLSFPDKRTALLAAFTSRFSLGFFAATINLRMSPIAASVLVGLLTSIPDAIVTKAYAPILITGVIFGAVPAGSCEAGRRRSDLSGSERYSAGLDHTHAFRWKSASVPN
jgi:hypothetical protein